MIDATHSDQASETSEQVVDTSEPYVGRWIKLVSTTNWEKGEIIHQWRTALVDSGSPATMYSDEAWAQRVGNVSSQHVGRLRRVFEQFGESREQYAGLFWSHFAQALDWDDAEMWLEGAVQNGWSVAQTRQERASTLGLVETSDADAANQAFDEDAEADDLPPLAPSMSVAHDTEPHDQNDSGGGDREPADRDDHSEGDGDVQGSVARNVEAEPRVRPFESLAALPDDLAEAMEEFKLAIVRHKIAGWSEVSRDDVLAHLDALRALVLAPADEA